MDGPLYGKDMRNLKNCPLESTQYRVISPFSRHLPILDYWPRYHQSAFFSERVVNPEILERFIRVAVAIDPTWHLATLANFYFCFSFRSPFVIVFFPT